MNIMNPIHQLISLFVSCEKRRCPECGSMEVVEKSKKHKKVKCENCGEILYPKIQRS